MANLGAVATWICVLSLFAGAAAGEMTLSGHTGTVTSVAWSPDGTKLASGSAYPDNTVRIWDISTGATLRTLSGHTDPVLSVAWSPDGTKVASGSGTMESVDNTVRIWDASTGSPLGTLTGHAGSVHSVAWRPDGTKLASGSDDYMVHIWDVSMVQAPAPAPIPTRTPSPGPDVTTPAFAATVLISIAAVAVRRWRVVSRSPVLLAPAAGKRPPLLDPGPPPLDLGLLREFDEIADFLRSHGLQIPFEANDLLAQAKMNGDSSKLVNALEIMRSEKVEAEEQVLKTKVEDAKVSLRQLLENDSNVDTDDIKALLTRAEEQKQLAPFEEASRLLSQKSTMLKEREEAVKEIRQIEKRLTDLAKRFAAGKIKESAYESARDSLELKQRERQNQLGDIDPKLYKEKYEKPIWAEKDEKPV